MSNLQLITTENFGSISCDFYRNMNNDILLTREQIGSALEYKYPDDALSKIHRRHKDRLDQFSVVAKLASTDGKEYDTYLYTQKVSWKSVVGAINQKPINSWIGVGT